MCARVAERVTMSDYSKKAADLLVVEACATNAHDALKQVMRLVRTSELPQDVREKLLEAQSTVLQVCLLACGRRQQEEQKR